MLYSSIAYIFAFLPLTVAAYFLVARWLGARTALYWLLLASLFFYAYAEPRHLLILLFSIGMNFLAARELARSGSKTLLSLIIAANLLLLGVFKYADFAVETLSCLGAQLAQPHLLLPIGISFFTFQQIAFLVETRRTRTSADPLQYSVLVSLFCHLISGPIVRLQHLMPQLGEPWRYRPDWNNIGRGVHLFAMGLAKKMYADILVPWSVFANPLAPDLPFSGAWLTALSYTLRIYFDFSAYIDMARASALFINLDFPINFDTPYKSADPSEFWRRWNISLSEFLRDYLYIPLGGSRVPMPRLLANLMTTMVLAGAWHGAGWTFLIWGAYHGVLLCVVRVWHRICSWRMPPFPARLATFLAVVVGWVFFKSANASEAFLTIRAMFGANGLDLPLPGLLLRPVQSGWVGEMLAALSIAPHPIFPTPGIYSVWQPLVLAGGIFVAAWGSNSNEIARNFRPTVARLAFCSAVFIISLSYLEDVKDFVYFQF